MQACTVSFVHLHIHSLFMRLFLYAPPDSRKRLRSNKLRSLLKLYRSEYPKEIRPAK